jgi:hypothetical protein
VETLHQREQNSHYRVKVSKLRPGPHSHSASYFWKQICGHNHGHLLSISFMLHRQRLVEIETTKSKYLLSGSLKKKKRYIDFLETIVLSNCFSPHHSM